MKNLVILLLLTYTIISRNQLNAQDNKIIPLNPLLENYEYPYPVKFITLSVQQGSYRMAYMDVRPEQPNGHTVLLFHGKNFSGAYWQKTAESLQKEGFRVIIPDQLGFGKSSKPAHVQYTFQLLALNTKKFIRLPSVNKNCRARSFNGRYAGYTVYIDASGNGKEINIRNPIGLGRLNFKVPYQPVAAWYKNELGQNYEKIKKHQQENYYHGQWKPEYEKWVTILAGWSVHPDYKTVAWNSALTYDMIFTQAVLYEFEKLKTPTILIIGQSDSTALGKQQVVEEVRKTLGDYQKLGRQTKQKIACSVLIELENVGHLPHIEAFEQFIAPLLAFLKKWHGLTETVRPCAFDTAFDSEREYSKNYCLL